MRTIVINLDTATDRWEKYKNKDVIRWRATPREEVSDKCDKKMLSMWNCSRDHHLGKCACSTSHMSVLQHIVDEKYEDNTLIQEDDSVVGEGCSEMRDEYPRDNFIYLAGFFHKVKMTDDTKPEVVSEVGLNLIDDKNLRIICMSAYVIPNWEVAKTILDFWHKKKRWKCNDIMIHEVPLPKLYQYPACFVEDNVKSNLKSKSKFSNSVYDRPTQRIRENPS
jgi:GR25 family glycosyltransferase involved in LPS biosynthesis